jgi:geranylgeranyl pyrophosphate synthase
MSLGSAWRDARRRVDEGLTALLAQAPPDARAVLVPALEGGKRFRPALLLLVHDALGGRDAARAEAHAVGLELVHTATLIHDDLVDGDDMRRGRLATHAAMERALRDAGAARTTAGGLAALAGDAALAWGLAQLRDAEAHAILSSALLDTWRGAWQEALPGALPWEEVALLKTASLFRAACALGAMAANASGAHRAEADAFGAYLGLAYQCADDAADRPPGAPPPEALRPRAFAEAAKARACIEGWPPSRARDALAEAPEALVRAALPLEEPA